jgi:hypothetical protein
MNILSPQPINGHRIASDISKYKGAFVLWYVTCKQVIIDWSWCLHQHFGSHYGF